MAPIEQDDGRGNYAISHFAGLGLIPKRICSVSIEDAVSDAPKHLCYSLPIVSHGEDNFPPQELGEYLGYQLPVRLPNNL